MKSYIVRKTQKSVKHTLKRDKSLHSEDTLRASTIVQRRSETSDKHNLLSSKNKAYSKSMTKANIAPYENFIKELKIRLPTPKQKFYQFLKIQPFNRIQNHNELIALFLKNIRFFKIHQSSLIVNLARKVRLVIKDELDEKMMLIVLEGQCNYQGQTFPAGHLINRTTLVPQSLSPDPSCKLLAINRHQYLSFLSSFIHQELFKFKEFIFGIQMFKMFNEKTIQNFTQSMSLHYYLKGEKLFRVGDEANILYVIFSGRASRRVVIEIEKINKIPTSKFQKEVRILSKSYSHQIEFAKEDMVGVSELIDNNHYRKEQIGIDEDSILLGIERSIMEESLDDYIIERLKKYNLKKYPSNYDELCSIYQKEKLEMRRSQQRKISALQNELKIFQNDRRREKIESIIKMYEQNIKSVDKHNLLSKKLHFEMDFNK